MAAVQPVSFMLFLIVTIMNGCLTPCGIAVLTVAIWVAIVASFSEVWLSTLFVNESSHSNLFWAGVSLAGAACSCCKCFIYSLINSKLSICSFGRGLSLDGPSFSSLTLSLISFHCEEPLRVYLILFPCIRFDCCDLVCLHFRIVQNCCSQAAFSHSALVYCTKMSFEYLYSLYRGLLNLECWRMLIY